MQEDEIPEVHWKQLLGNPYRHILHPQMLSEQGYKLYLYCRVIGDKKSDPARPMIVLIDKEYVKKWIKINIFDKLNYPPSVALEKISTLFEVTKKAAEDGNNNKEKIDAKQALNAILDRQPIKSTVRAKGADTK